MLNSKVARIAVAGLGVLLLAGCGKRTVNNSDGSAKSRDNTEDGSRVIATREIATPADLVGGKKAEKSPRSTGQDPSSPDRLKGDYTATSETDDRIDIIYQLADVGTVDALRAMGWLFQIEADPELKSEIISALDDVDGQNEVRVAIYAIALHPDQPDEVRQAAVDALENIVDAQALPVWRTLLNDRDLGIRESAQEQIKALESLSN